MRDCCLVCLSVGAVMDWRPLQRVTSRLMADRLLPLCDPEEDEAGMVMENWMDEISCTAFSLTVLKM